MPAKAPFEFSTKAEGECPAAPASVRARSRRRESVQEKAERSVKIASRLAELYSDVRCPLSHGNNFELLIAVILSAQCTDAAVNRITPALFKRFVNPEALARARLADIESHIRSLGLFRAKAKSLKRCAQQLLDEFSGAVPAAMEELTRLAGVGRKTANVIRGHAFGLPGIAVDTHCRRLARRLGLTRGDDPVKIEADLAKIVPVELWTAFSQRLILHGRQVCHARTPACAKCALRGLCPSDTTDGGTRDRSP
jgi:endonuclease-3